MGTQFFTVDTFENHKSKGDLDLVNNTIKVALCSDFVPSYSAHATETSYAEGDIVVPTTRNGRRYRATNAGTSGASEPTWPTTAGETVTDNDITWEEYGGEHADIEFFDEVSANELADGDGYSAGGVELLGKSVGSVTNDPAITAFDGQDAVFSSLSKTMRTAWLYVDGTTPGTDDYVLMYILLNDTPSDVTVSGADFTIPFDDAGILHFGRKANI
jgi:hypothetical protein